MNNDFDFEPLPGLPAPLPAGERLLWQGVPQWRTLAVRAYHVRKVAWYFAALTCWTLVHGLISGRSPRDIGISCGLLLLAGTAGIAVLALLAHLSARATVYTITSRRILIRHGIAVPMTLNLPFGRIDGVALRDDADGSGDLALRIGKDDRVGYLITWPHLRSRCFARPEPSLLAVANVRGVATQLLEAMTPHAPRSPDTRPALRGAANGPTATGPTPKPATASSLLPGAVA